MEDAKALTQQQLMLQQQQQQQLLLFQQMQRQKQQQEAISRFPSNIDAHLRPQLLSRSINHQQSQLQSQLQTQQQSPNPIQNPNHPIVNQQNPSSNPQHQIQQQQQLQQKVSRPPPANQAELQMAYQDAWRVCHPDFRRPFSSLEDACERLLPYHVVADYEAEEDDRILDSDTTGQMLSRSQQWDHNIAVKVAEFTATFEKQVLAFNIISRKRTLGEFRSEERLMIEQALLQEERRALIEARMSMESRRKMGQEASLRTMVHPEQQQGRAEPQAHAEMMARAPIRASVLGRQGSNVSVGHDIGEQEQEGNNPDEMINGWGNSTQRDDREPSEDFLNDEEAENGDTSLQSEWHGGGELDLNTR